MLDWRFWAFWLVVAAVIFVIVSNPVHYGSALGNGVQGLFTFLETALSEATG